MKKTADSATLAAALGNAFRAVKSTKREAGLVQVEHVASKTLFVAVPGGTFELGPSRAEVEELAKLDFNEEVTREQVEAMKKRRTTKKTKVAAFLCARAPACGELTERVLGKMGWAIDEEEPAAGPVRLAPADASKLVRAFAKDGLRFLTDPEWEWVAREGGECHWINGKDARGAEKACAALYNTRFDRDIGRPATNGFGVWGLPWGDFVTDAKGTRRTATRVRGGAAMLYPWQTDEILMCVASFGYAIGKSKSECGVRFAVDIPARLSIESPS
jgi:hypothetical protein